MAGSWVRVPVTNGQIIISVEDYDLYKSRKWHINDGGYAVHRGGHPKTTTRLHRLIAKTPKELVTDHINRNPRDNRRENLRITTQQVNSTNQERVENAKGYYFHTQTGKWSVDYKRTYYAIYNTEEEAQQAVESIKDGTFVKPDYYRICKQGHDLEVTGYYMVKGHKTRWCKPCMAERQRAYHIRKKGKVL